MFGPHDAFSRTRGVRFVVVRICLVAAPLFILLAGAPMLLFLLPLVFIGLPFLVASVLSGASRNRFETKHIQRCRAFAHAAHGV